MRKSPKFSPEVIERAVRMVFDAKDQYPSQWAAIESIAGKIGCTAETLRKWVRQGEGYAEQVHAAGSRSVVVR
jgi:transposase